MSLCHCWLAPLLLGPVISIEAYSEVFMSEAQAAAALFPARDFKAFKIKFTPEEKAKIEHSLGDKISLEGVHGLRAASGEWVVFDRVLGKHEYITYAVGLTKPGKIKGIEILEYRENYGREIRHEGWREQFAGKDTHSALRVDSDIKNISGATLSSNHVTNGARRVVHTFEVIKDRT